VYSCTRDRSSRSAPLGRAGISDPLSLTAPPSARAGSSPCPADDQARPDEVLDPPDDAALVEPEAESPIARQIRERAEQDQRDTLAAAAEAERARVARALVDRETLRYRLARPELARHMLPFMPACPSEGGKCRGCARTLPAWARAGHVVEMAEKGRERCAAWALGLPPA